MQVPNHRHSAILDGFGFLWADIQSCQNMTEDIWDTHVLLEKQAQGKDITGS